MMDDIVNRVRQHSYFGTEPYEAADEIERLRQRLAAHEAVTKQMREALHTATETFNEYAEIHAAKTPPDTVKADFNRDRAQICKAALSLQPTTEHLDAYIKERLGEPVAWIYDTNMEALLPGDLELTHFKARPELYTPLYALEEGE